MATKTQTPIGVLETLLSNLDLIRQTADTDALRLVTMTPEGWDALLSVADARAALEDVAALVEPIEALLALVDESVGIVGWHLNGAVAEWGEFEFISDLRTAIAKFTVKSSGDALDEERFAMLRGEVPAMNDLDSGVDAGQTHSDEPTDAEEREGMLKMVNATPPANQLEARYGLWISRLIADIARLKAEVERGCPQCPHCHPDSRWP